MQNLKSEKIYMELNKNTTFDFIVGNVPWDKGIDKRFLQKCKNTLLSPTGTMALITSASYLRGSSNSNKELRLSFTNGNVKKIITYPADVFISPVTNQPIKGIGACIIFTNGEHQKNIDIVRYFGNTSLTTSTVFEPSQGNILYLGEKGKEIWDICTKNTKSIPLNPYQHSSKPKIHFNSKLDMDYLGSSKPLGTINGSKLLTGVVLDLDGIEWLPELKILKKKKEIDCNIITMDDVADPPETNHSAKRYMLTFNEKYQAINAGYHFKTRIFGLLLAMTSTISHVSQRTLGALPYDILIDKEYESLDEYTKAYYTSKKFSDEHIAWIETVGKDLKVSDNLKDDSTIKQIHRSHERVKNTGEVFTPKYYICEIINDLVDIGLCDIGKRSLEPTCGDGNFIIAIIQAKLDSGQSITDALSTTFAVDLMADNIKLCKQRILDLVGDTHTNREIINNNIICSDFFTGWDLNNWTPRTNLV